MRNLRPLGFAALWFYAIAITVVIVYIASHGFHTIGKGTL